MSALRPIRVLVIDDSAYSRQAITRILDSSPLVEVVGTAGDGEEALRKTFDLAPDLITLDLEMPKMDGFTFLRIVMSKRPTPVMVISGRAGDEHVFRALEFGAVDFIAKPTAPASHELAAIEHELIRKTHAIRELRIEKVRDRLGSPTAMVGVGRGRAPRIAVIGSSTGGPAALLQLFGSFKESPPTAFLVAQHMPKGFTRSFAERLDRLTPLHAREAVGGEEPRPGTILVAPGGQHLELESVGSQVVTRVTPAEGEGKYVPSADRLFTSAANHFGSDVFAVVLTGMGDDGREGVVAVRAGGGAVVAESEETAVIFGMPRQAIRTGCVDRVLPLHEIAASIQSGVRVQIGDRANPRGPR
jgi:two-component system chemotaxis response regulator CheB